MSCRCILGHAAQGNADELFLFASEPAEARRRQRLVSLCARLGPWAFAVNAARGLPVVVLSIRSAAGGTTKTAPNQYCRYAATPVQRSRRRPAFAVGGADSDADPAGAGQHRASAARDSAAAKGFADRRFEPDRACACAAVGKPAPN